MQVPLRVHLIDLALNEERLFQCVLSEIFLMDYTVVFKAVRKAFCCLIGYIWFIMFPYLFVKTATLQNQNIDLFHTSRVSHCYLDNKALAIFTLILYQ